MSGRLPFRPWVSYKEITHIYTNPYRPKFFVLCIDLQQSAKKYYEIYKCKTSANVERIKHLLMQAIYDPDKLLRNAYALRYVTSPQKNEANEVVPTKEEAVEDQDRTPGVKTDAADTSVPTLPTVSVLQDSPDHISISPLKDSPEVCLDNLQVIRISQRKQDSEQPSPIILSFPRENSPETSEIQYDMPITEILDNVSFICFDPHEGLTVGKSGPVYMFLARQEFHMNGLMSRDGSPIQSHQEDIYSPTIKIKSESRVKQFT
ncbi:unnamed protein product [Heterobilharzia americana]|nr:unnamed protein product [Heterobilharzia americana]